MWIQAFLGCMSCPLLPRSCQVQCWGRYSILKFSVYFQLQCMWSQPFQTTSSKGKCQTQEIIKAFLWPQTQWCKVLLHSSLVGLPMGVLWACHTQKITGITKVINITPNYQSRKIGRGKKKKQVSLLGFLQMIRCMDNYALVDRNSVGRSRYNFE